MGWRRCPVPIPPGPTPYNPLSPPLSKLITSIAARRLLDHAVGLGRALPLARRRAAGRSGAAPHRPLK